MTNTHADWLSRPPQSLKIVAYQRECGWHVIVSQTGKTVQSNIVPRVIAKSCVPLHVDPDQTRVLDQLRAVVIGLDNIIHSAPEECNRL